MNTSNHSHESATSYDPANKNENIIWIENKNVYFTQEVSLHSAIESDKVCNGEEAAQYYHKIDFLLPSAAQLYLIHVHTSTQFYLNFSNAYNKV